MRCCSLSLSATGEAARPASQQRLRVAFVVASGLRVQLRSPRIGLCGRILALDNLGETRFVLILGFRRRRSLSKRHSHQIHGYLRLRSVLAKMMDGLRHVCTGPVGPTSTVRIRTTLQQARVQKTPQLSGSSTPISLGKSATPLKNSRVKTPTDDCCHSSRPEGRQIKRTAVFI